MWHNIVTPGQKRPLQYYFGFQYSKRSYDVPTTIYELTAAEASTEAFATLCSYSTFTVSILNRIWINITVLVKLVFECTNTINFDNIIWQMNQDYKYFIKETGSNN